MADLRIFSKKSFLLVQIVCTLLMSFATRNISAALETEVTTYNVSDMVPFDNSPSNISHRYQNLRALFGQHRTGHSVRSQAWFSDYSQGRSIFKNVSEYYDEGIVLVVSLDGTAQYSNIQDAIDQVPEFNTRRVTIFVTSGVYEWVILNYIHSPIISLFYKYFRNKFPVQIVYGALVFNFSSQVCCDWSRARERRWKPYFWWLWNCEQGEGNHPPDKTVPNPARWRQNSNYYNVAWHCGFCGDSNERFSHRWIRSLHSQRYFLQGKCSNRCTRRLANPILPASL